MEMDGIYTGLQKPSEDVYSTVNQPQGKRAGAQQGDPTAGKAPPYRQAALVLAGLCALSVAAIIFLTVYMFTLEKNYSIISENYSALDQYCPVTNTSSKERVCEACPQNWDLFNGKCYYFSTDRMNWTSSRDNCTSLGGHLVIIESDVEQRFLSDKALIITRSSQGAYRYEDKSYWIGLTDAVTEGTWLWVDGTPLIDNVQAKFWATRTHDNGKEPDDNKREDPSGEDCAQLQTNRNSKETWFDSSCKKQYKRICETKALIVYKEDMTG
ncbi:C-type lectin domain family 4 member E-like [Acipenser ruthenus]|uniref:C-type lectin domain family 4 member E-like n=1 Tax=Acipenser ruthenus TaxID=7906 RepID=UPI002740E90F|nr:C-type lectin domain family 4 member E-like [Acipenser ruthenus]